MSEFKDDRSVLARVARAPDSVVRYGDHADHIADVRLGKEGATRLPLVILIHGGFWRPAFDRKHTGPMCEAIADAGWSIASIEYRRTPGNPDVTVADILDAIVKVPAHVQRHSGKVILMGHSAGGHLCLYAGAKTTSSHLLGLVALAPAADLQMAERLNLGDGAARAFLGVPASQREDLDPTRLPSPAMATTLVHGDHDAIVPLAVAESYLRHVPSARLARLENCGHFGVIDPLSAAWPHVVSELARLSGT